MNLKNLMSTWKEYQKWLKQQGINSANIQQKLPEFIEQLKQDPKKLQKVKGILEDKNLLSYAKQLNINTNDIDKMKGMLENTTIPSARTMPKFGNLTKEQLNQIKKFKH